MGLGDWRARQQMRDPVRGVFRKTGFYDRHPASNPPGTRMTGVIIAPGVPAMAAEHRVDGRGRWAGQEEFPVVVDRADPARFAILWSELEAVPWRDRELASAPAEADRLSAGPHTSFGPHTSAGPHVGAGPDVGTGSDPGARANVPGPPDPACTQDGGAGPDGPYYPAVQGPALPQATIGQAMRAAAAGRPEFFGARGGRPVPGTPGGGFSPEQSADPLAHSVSMGGSAGQRASAVVAGVREIAIPAGLPSALGGIVDLTLDITVPDGTRYTTVTRVGFSTPERRLRVAAPGTELMVLIDPADRTRVAIDTSGLF
jgi:hypothetical protein